MLRTSANGEILESSRQTILSNKPPLIPPAERIAGKIDETKDKLASANTQQKELLELQIKTLENQRLEALKAPKIVSQIQTPLKLTAKSAARIHIEFNDDATLVMAYLPWESQTPKTSKTFTCGMWKRVSAFERGTVDAGPLQADLNYISPTTSFRFLPWQSHHSHPNTLEFELRTGSLNYWERPLGTIALSTDRSKFVAGIMGRSLEKTPVLAAFDAESLEQTGQYEAMEAYVAGIRFLPNSDLVVASVRERNKVRLIVVDTNKMEEIDVLEELESIRRGLMPTEIAAAQQN